MGIVLGSLEAGRQDRRGAVVVAESLNFIHELEAKNQRDWEWCKLLKPQKLTPSGTGPQNPSQTAPTVRDQALPYVSLWGNYYPIHHTFEDKFSQLPYMKTEHVNFSYFGL